jgi:hypothetical protein
MNTPPCLPPTPLPPPASRANLVKVCEDKHRHADHKAG